MKQATILIGQETKDLIKVTRNIRDALHEKKKMVLTPDEEKIGNELLNRGIDMRMLHTGLLII